MGAPRGDTEEEYGIERELNMHLRALAELLPCEYSDSDACKQAVLEIECVASDGSATCKRALMLYSLATESAICDYWLGRDADSAALAQELRSRVLPLTVPRFLKTSAQRPVSYTHLTLPTKAKV